MNNISANQILQELQDINNKFTEMGFPICIHHQGDKYPIEGIDVFYSHDEKTRAINGIHSIDLNTGIEAEQKSRAKAIYEAKEVLRQAGYFIDNLWHIEDVMGRYVCDEETAMEVLEFALTNDTTMEQIHFAIGIQAKDIELKEQDDAN